MKHAPFSKLEALTVVRDDRSLSKAEKLVLVMLISRASTKATRRADRVVPPGSSWPSLETLAEDCGMARSIVAAAIKTLPKKAGGRLTLTVEHWGRADGSGGRSSNLYRLTLNPESGLKSSAVKSNSQTQPQGDLSPKAREVESEKPWGLSPPGGLEAGKEAGKRSRKASKRTASQAAADPQVPQLWAHYHAEHERLRQVAPVFAPSQRGAVGKAWKEMLQVVSLDEAKAVVSRALNEGFHVQPTAILQSLNRYRGPQIGSVRKLQVQRGTPDGVDSTTYGKEGAKALLGGAE